MLDKMISEIEDLDRKCRLGKWNIDKFSKNSLKFLQQAVCILDA